MAASFRRSWTRYSVNRFCLPALQPPKTASLILLCIWEAVFTADGIQTRLSCASGRIASFPSLVFGSIFSKHHLFHQCRFFLSASALDSFCQHVLNAFQYLIPLNPQHHRQFAKQLIFSLLQGLRIGCTQPLSFGCQHLFLFIE